MSTPQGPLSTASAPADKPGFRTKSLGTRLMPEELKEVEAAAERAGKNPSEWVREAVLKAARPSESAPTELLLEELAALRYILFNLFEGSAQAAQQNTFLPADEIHTIRENADRKKQARARKLIQEFRERDSRVSRGSETEGKS